MAGVNVFGLRPWADDISWTWIYQRAEARGSRQVLSIQKALGSAFCAAFSVFYHHKDRVSAQEVKSLHLILIFEAEIYFQVKFTFHKWHSTGIFLGFCRWTTTPGISNTHRNWVAQRLWSKACFSGRTKRNQCKYFNLNRNQKSLLLEDVQKRSRIVGILTTPTSHRQEKRYQCRPSSGSASASFPPFHLHHDWHSQAAADASGTFRIKSEQRYTLAGKAVSVATRLIKVFLTICMLEVL